MYKRHAHSRLVMKKLLLCLLTLALLTPVHAATYSTIDWQRLPLYNIFDPFTHQNELITHYSYEELSELSTNLDFRQWNDMERFCESMQLMFDKGTAACSNLPEPEFPRAPTARAYVYLQILPRPIAPDPGARILVDPVYPPWSPTYNPYW